MLWPIVITVIAAAASLLVLWGIGRRRHVVLPTTRQTFKDYGVWRVFVPSTWHFYVYGRWPMQYIGLLIHRVFSLLDRLGTRARRWFADGYHGKTLTYEHAKSIINIDRTIPLRDLDRVVPYSKARHMLLETPLDIAVFECPCRHARESPCQPTQVCLIIGQPFVDLILDYHPQTSRRMSRGEALDLLEAEHRRGHVHVAWFKDCCLDRFFAICNCCKCCCGGIDAMVNHGIPMIASSGYVARVAQERCLGCGKCESLCAFNAIKVEQAACVATDRCMGCGVCVDHCPQSGISLEAAPDRGIPLDVADI